LPDLLARFGEKGEGKEIGRERKGVERGFRGRGNLLHEAAGG